MQQRRRLAPPWGRSRYEARLPLPRPQPLQRGRRRRGEGREQCGREGGRGGWWGQRQAGRGQGLWGALARLRRSGGGHNPFYQKWRHVSLVWWCHIVGFLTDDVMYFVMTSRFSTDDVMSIVVTSRLPYRWRHALFCDVTVLRLWCHLLCCDLTVFHWRRHCFDVTVFHWWRHVLGFVVLTSRFPTDDVMYLVVTSRFPTDVLSTCFSHYPTLSWILYSNLNTTFPSREQSYRVTNRKTKNRVQRWEPKSYC